MADFDTTILKNNKDISKISVKIKKHIRHGRHVSKYKFADDPVSYKFKLIKVYYTRYITIIVTKINKF